MTYTYSLHKIENGDSFGFCPSHYSRFKFGDEAVAKDFGTELAKGFIRDYLSIVPVTQQIVVISSPYSFIPTATFAMKNYFVAFLNRWLAEQGLPVVQETKVHRTITYKEDYGELDAAQRINLISNDRFHIDRAFLEGKTLVFLDDIRITGSHEKMIRKMAGQYGLDNPMFLLYYAELVNSEIHPSIENYLNYFSVKDIYDLQPIISSGHFFINTRIVKYLLNYEPSGFRSFMEAQPESFRHTVYDMAIGNSYHTIDAYARNLATLRRSLSGNTSKKLIEHGD